MTAPRVKLVSDWIELTKYWVLFVWPSQPKVR